MADTSDSVTNSTGLIDDPTGTLAYLRLHGQCGEPSGTGSANQQSLITETILAQVTQYIFVHRQTCSCHAVEGSLGALGTTGGICY